MKMISAFSKDGKIFDCPLNSDRYIMSASEIMTRRQEGCRYIQIINSETFLAKVIPVVDVHLLSEGNLTEDLGYVNCFKFFNDSVVKFNGVGLSWLSENINLGVINQKDKAEVNLFNCHLFDINYKKNNRDSNWVCNAELRSVWKVVKGLSCIGIRLKVSLVTTPFFKANDLVKDVIKLFCFFDKERRLKGYIALCDEDCVEIVDCCGLSNTSTVAKVGMFLTFKDDEWLAKG